MKSFTDSHAGSELIDFCARLDAYLRERFGYKTSCVSCSALNRTVNASRKKFDLYIRVFEEGNESWGGKAIVISQIGFEKTRQGHGSDFLRFVTEFAQEHQYDVIGMEQAGSPSIHQFADKHGFRKMKDTADYTATVRQLAG